MTKINMETDTEGRLISAASRLHFYTLSLTKLGYQFTDDDTTNWIVKTPSGILITPDNVDVLLDHLPTCEEAILLNYWFQLNDQANRELCDQPNSVIWGCE